MTDERRDLDALRGTACDLRDEDCGKAEAFAAAMVSAVNRPESGRVWQVTEGGREVCRPDAQ